MVPMESGSGAYSDKSLVVTIIIINKFTNNELTR